MSYVFRILCLVTGLSLGFQAVADDSGFITVASTTSTDNSGLFKHLLPIFESKTGIEVRVVAVGTGQAIKIGRNGDADVLFVHHKMSEERFVAEGFGVERFDVMYNDFVLVGPENDPARIRNLEEVTVALKSIADTKQLFASRGDDSGTHRKEQELWAAAGVTADDLDDAWYRETGSGMGATLNVASTIDAYAITDRATWLFFMNKGNLQLLFEGEPRLFNQYGVVLINRETHPHVKSAQGQRFIDWLLSEEGQSVISSYTIKGEQAFFANAKGG